MKINIPFDAQLEIWDFGLIVIHDIEFGGTSGDLVLLLTLH